MFSFKQVKGNPLVIQNLQQAIRTNRIPHAIIFSGQTGLGKNLIANSLAKTLQCEQGQDDSCNQCISCMTYESGNHPDVFYIKPTKTKSIGVDDVREQICKKMDVKPYQYPYKIFIIEQADSLTIAAQNALLKTIEEPASFGIFLLLCENHHRLLPTILSRCVLFKLKPVPLAQVEQYLQTHANLSPENSTLFSMYAQGNIGRALSLIHDEDFIQMREQILSIAMNLHKESPITLFAFAKDIEKYKDRIQEALEILFLWYRDLAVFKELNHSQYLTQKDKIDQIENFASRFSVSSLLKKCDAILKAKQQLLQYGNFQLVIEIMLLTLKET